MFFKKKQKSQVEIDAENERIELIKLRINAQLKDAEKDMTSKNCTIGGSNTCVGKACVHFEGGRKVVDYFGQSYGVLPSCKPWRQ